MNLRSGSSAYRKKDLHLSEQETQGDRSFRRIETQNAVGHERSQQIAGRALFEAGNVRGVSAWNLVAEQNLYKQKRRLGQAYPTEAIIRVVHGHPRSRAGQLMPWNFAT